MKTTCYHARGQNDVKTVGGTLKYATLDDGAKFVESCFDVMVLPSGRVSFAQNGKPVFVYLSVDPAQTEKGRAAIAADSAQRAARHAEIKARETELQDLIDSIGVDAALSKLKGE